MLADVEFLSFYEGESVLLEDILDSGFYAFGKFFGWKSELLWLSTSHFGVYDVVKFGLSVGVAKVVKLCFNSRSGGYQYEKQVKIRKELKCTKETRFKLENVDLHE